MCICFESQQGKGGGTTREWTEQETLLLLEVSLFMQRTLFSNFTFPYLTFLHNKSVNVTFLNMF